MRKVLFITFLVLALPLISPAQFNSGSTGADGALDLSAMNCPNNVCEVQLPESGILNYTTVSISGKTLRFKRNSRNTSAIILAQGNIIISSTINIQGGNPTSPFIDRTIPGPGGFYGGTGGRPGFGPGGGGITVASSSGRWVGPLSLVPIVGGSGGGSVNGLEGGGGGGAIVIASSTSITMSGLIYAGGNSAVSTGNGFGGTGGGGAIRLLANTLNISGTLNTCQEGSCGVVRLEATSLTFTGISNPLATSSPINPNIISSAVPQLTIASIGGYSVPSYAGSRFDLIDLLLPNQLPDPINVIVSANNIPVGAEVQVGFVSGSLNGTSTPCNLAGTFSSSQCTATISNLNRTGGTYLLATATFTPPDALAEYNLKGENQVAKIKLETTLGSKPKYIFLRTDGSVIDTKKILPQFLQQFGM